MGNKKKLKKEETAENWCFVCKDGGDLIICDYKDCVKAYHPDCVDKDDSLVEAKEKWICNWHFCSECNNAPRFYCLCCPSAICRHCLCDAEFAIVKGNKGLCNDCLELALLIEEEKDVHSNGCKIDFNDRDTTEFLFYDYWHIIKKEEDLTSAQVISAYNQLRRAENYSHASDSDEYDEEEEDIDDSEYESPLGKRKKRGKIYRCASDSDDCDEEEEDIGDLNDTSQIGKRKRSKGKLSATKGKMKSTRREFIGWGSKPLLEFLASIGEDTTRVLSQDEVTTLISEYCKENKLFHPENKRKIICDARLKALFGRDSVNRNSISKLLTTHFVEILDHSKDEFGCNLENGEEDEDDVVASKRRQQSSSVKRSYSKEVVVDVQKSCFASIVPRNIKLIYLRKSLVEELAKQLETFDAKVMGSFVRVRSQPNDHLQKYSHQLVRVTGIIKISSRDSEILLQVSNMVEGISICKLSDDDFSEEECQDLCQKVKNGLLEKLTVVELEQKARSLHEDITKHWIARELVLLQKRIDKANEKGWRREVCECIDRLMLLRKPSEQSRLLSEIPKIIADIVEIELSSEETTREDEKEHNVDSPESASRRAPNSCNMMSNGISCCLNDSKDAAAITTNGETQTTATSDKQHRVGSHSEATGLSPAPAHKASDGEAPNSAVECIVADNSTDTSERGGERSNDPKNGKTLELHNGSSLRNDRLERVWHMVKSLAKQIKQLEKIVEEMR